MIRLITLNQSGQLILNDLGQALRKKRNHSWQIYAQHTFHKTLSTQQVCKQWSDLADELLSEAFAACQLSFPLKTKLALFAYGKLGSSELNLSSDVDLVLISEESDDPNLMPWLRYFRELLQDLTSDGFCFRLDFDLRPGGRSGRLICTALEFEDYFSNYGEAWERLAFVRFRSICGSPELIQFCIEKAYRFTYRKHLDFGLMDDLKNLRQKIHEQNWRRSLNGAIDLKLGLGGIRDLELFVHTLQVIHGGRNAHFRVLSTEEALHRLAEANLLSPNDVDFLIEHYWQLRHFENILQAKTDQQIQVLPVDEFLNQISAAERELLQKQMQSCNQLVNSLLGSVDQQVRSLPELESEQSLWLNQLGLSQEKQQALWPEILHRKIFSRTRERDELYRKRFLYEIMNRLGQFPKKINFSIELVNDFLRSIRAKPSFFHLLLQNQDLIDRLALLFSTTPTLSQILIRRPELLDSILFQNKNPVSPQIWEEFLDQQIEKKLLAQLSLGLEFLHDQQVEPITKRLSHNADEIVCAIQKKILADYPANFEILCMGKWGGSELGFYSDLDLIFISEKNPTENDLRAARRLISRLTELQKGGSLFQLDFRLKPQGKAGPLLISQEELLKYISETAAPWEKQAYLKSRPLHSNDDLKKQILFACTSHPLQNEQLKSLRQIRKELQEKTKGSLDLKHQAGGLVDVEFATQVFRLEQQQQPVSSNTFDELTDLELLNPAWRIVRSNYVELRKMEQLFRLTSSRSISFLEPASSEFDNLALTLKLEPAELSRRISSLLQENAAHLRELDPRQTYD